MNTSGGQLCARARFWASLRLDDEISVLEAALLDAHVARCADCAAYVSSATAATAALRAAPLEVAKPITIPPQRSRRHALTLVAAAALVGAAALLGVLGDSTRSTGGSPAPARIVAVVATVETPDQIRRLRRTSLLNTRPVPPELRA